jgi:drug/metabolite transporter (DMT)-like permease
MWALGAAVSFGVTTPLVARLSVGLGVWSTAALLYAGAAIFALPLARDVKRVLRNRGSRGILLAEAVVGAMLAPAALAYGLKSAGALPASLTLNAEVPFSIALAAFVFREHVPRRVVIASVVIVAGTSLLLLNGSGTTHAGIGLVFIVAATFFWAIDNALSSLLLDVQFATTVACKSIVGASFAALAAVLAREPSSLTGSALWLVLVGMLGYGASLWAYLRAQRTFGIARTASVFALAPFIGAALAFAFGERHFSLLGLVALALVAAGAYLHTSERHSHRHAHEAREHDHPHVHDDAHHDHDHDHRHDEPLGEHAHHHRHTPLVHDHPHASDPDHLHVHEPMS